SKTGSISRITTALSDDQLTAFALGAVMTSVTPPDLAIAELNILDGFQHDFGYESPEAHFATSFLDTLLGQCLDQLRQAGRLDEYVFAIASDHGHANVRDSLYPRHILPSEKWYMEGGFLHVLVEDVRHRSQIVATLAEHGAEAWNSDHIPED